MSPDDAALHTQDLDHDSASSSPVRPLKPRPPYSLSGSVSFCLVLSHSVSGQIEANMLHCQRTFLFRQRKIVYQSLNLRLSSLHSKSSSSDLLSASLLVFESYKLNKHVSGRFWDMHFNIFCVLIELDKKININPLSVS